MAMNALLGGKKQSSGGGGIGGLASQFLSGSGGGHSGGSSSGGGSGIAGKLAGQLASNLFSPAEKPPPPQNYHGGQNSNKPSHQGGIAGAVFGGVAHMFGGKESSGVSVCSLSQCIYAVENCGSFFFESPLLTPGITESEFRIFQCWCWIVLWR